MQRLNSDFHFCLLLQNGWIRWLLRISVGEKGWCVSTIFFSYFITFYLLGYFRIVFFFLSGHMVLRLQFARAFENGSRVWLRNLIFFALPSNPLPLPLTPFVSLRGVFDICFTTRACPWSCFFLLDSAFALCFFLFLFLMGSLILSLSIGIQVLLFFRLLATEWELEGLGGGGGTKKMRTWGFFCLVVTANWHGFFL